MWEGRFVYCKILPILHPRLEQYLITEFAKLQVRSAVESWRLI